MQKQTRVLFNQFMSRLAQLNGISVADVVSKFAVEPAIQQTMERKIQESSLFLKSINVHGVTAQEGEKIGVGVSGPIASRTDTSANDRSTKDVSSLDSNKYRCEQTNYDTHIRYATLDSWALHPEFQVLLTNAIIQRIALDRIMIGFNGTSVASTTNPTTNPLLQDVNKGWLQMIRENAPERRLFETVADSGVLNVGGAAEYKNLDALVYDMVNSLIEPWYQDSTDLVCVTGRKLLADKYFPLVNKTQDPTEQLATDMIISQKRIGGLPAARVPSFPANAVLITSLKNLSIYYQSGSQRRSVIDNPKRDRIETYQSSNDSYVVEDYGCAAMAENITVADE
jgi:P2 family phage major capsid protein